MEEGGNSASPRLTLGVEGLIAVAPSSFQEEVVFLDLVGNAVLSFVAIVLNF